MKQFSLPLYELFRIQKLFSVLFIIFFLFTSPVSFFASFFCSFISFCFVDKNIDGKFLLVVWVYVYCVRVRYTTDYIHSSLHGLIVQFLGYSCVYVCTSACDMCT